MNDNNIEKNISSDSRKKLIFLAFCRHKVMLHFRIFSDYIYIQNPVDLQVLSRNVSFCNRNLRILASVKTIFQQNFGNVYFWYPKDFTIGLTGKVFRIFGR